MKVKIQKPSYKRLKTKNSTASDPSAVLQTERDFKDAVLTVSVFVNLFILCVWVALQTTSQYDTALAQFFLDR